jgi:heme/copper-type cytochrome/quinol oxidase subunit 3
VRLGRLRTGELIALAGTVGLLVTLSFDWFGVSGAAPRGGGAGDGTHYAPLHGLHQAGWTSLGWLMVVLLCVAIFGGLALTYATLRRSTPAWPSGASVLTAWIGALIFLILLVRVITQPGLGADLPSSVVTVQLAAYLGLVFAALIPVGGWLALKDERLDAPESAYTPPPARPVPGT